MRTWEAANTFTDDVLREVTHCSPDRTRFIGPWGSFDLPPTFVRPATVTPQASVAEAKVKEALGPFVDVLRCLLKAKWPAAAPRLPARTPALLRAAPRH